VAALKELAARLADAPPPSDELRDIARQRLFDALLAALIGRRLPEAAPLAGLPSGDHGRLRRLTATIRATEIDDIAISGCVTPGSVVVPTALHLASQTRADAAAVQDAILAGYEAMVAFGEAIGGATAIYGGVWPTLSSAPIGAAATAVRLKGLDAGRTLAALAMAVGRSSGRLNRTMPRWLSLGHAAVDGVRAVEAALAGFGAPASALEAWSSATGIKVRPEAMAPKIRSRLLAVDVKPFPTARQALAAIEAFRSLQAEQPIGSEDHIVIGLPSAYRAMIGDTRLPDARMPSLVSAAYQMALIACAPGAIDDAVRDPPRSGPAIAAFLVRVSVEADAELDKAFPRAWGGRVRIAAAGTPGREALVLEPPGAASLPFDWGRLEEKARRLCLANGIDLALVAALLDAVKADAPAQELLDFIS
jgi:2-methylcitrate dehydratase PrpD